MARAEQQIERLAGCTEPVRLTGYTTTGDVLHSCSTSQEPAGIPLIKCGNRRALAA